MVSQKLLKGAIGLGAELVQRGQRTGRAYLEYRAAVVVPAVLSNSIRLSRPWTNRAHASSSLMPSVLGRPSNAA